LKYQTCILFLFWRFKIHKIHDNKWIWNLWSLVSEESQQSTRNNVHPLWGCKSAPTLRRNRNPDPWSTFEPQISRLWHTVDSFKSFQSGLVTGCWC